MKDSSPLAVIAGDPEIAALLGDYFDFDVSGADETIEPCRLVGADYRVIGSAASGDLYVQVLSSATGGPIACIGHGLASVIAEDVEEFFALLIGAPYWSDLLKFSGGGQLAEMRRARRILEQEALEEEPELDSARERVARALGCAPTGDLVARLHAAVNRDRPFRFATKVDGEHEEALDSLVRNFVVDDNPMWRQHRA